MPAMLGIPNGQVRLFTSLSYGGKLMVLQVSSIFPDRTIRLIECPARWFFTTQATPVFVEGRVDPARGSKPWSRIR